MIARYVLHLEAHRGRLPRVSLRRAPRHGDRVVDGGIPGTLVACEPCSAEGFLVEPGRPLTVLERFRYSVAAGVNIPPRLIGLPPLADQGVRAVPSPAGKNDQATTRAPLPPRPDDAAEAAAREYFGSAYADAAGHGDPATAGALVAFRAGWDRATALLEGEVRAIRRAGQDEVGALRRQRDEARDLTEGLQAEVDRLRRTPYARSGDPLAQELVRHPAAEAAARAHPLHGVIAEALRWGNPAGERGGAPTDHLWGTAYGGASSWHGDPDEVAALVLRAIAAAPAGPVTREAWTRLRESVTR